MANQERISFITNGSARFVRLGSIQFITIKCTAIEARWDFSQFYFVKINKNEIYRRTMHKLLNETFVDGLWKYLEPKILLRIINECKICVAMENCRFNVIRQATKFNWLNNCCWKRLNIARVWCAAASQMRKRALGNCERRREKPHKAA